MPEDNKTSSSRLVSVLASARDMRQHPKQSSTTTFTLNSNSAEHLALLQYLQRLAREKFFGQLCIEFVKGEINIVRVQQSLKPWDLASAESPATTLGTAGGSHESR
jgi:hypothetical protein